MEKKTRSPLEIVRMVSLAVFFAGCAVIGYLIFSTNEALLSKNELQQILYPLGLGVLLSGLLTATLAMLMKNDEPKERPLWFYPALSALLTFCGLGLAYVFLGIWPVGEKSCMLVDMHHQYAPLLMKLREMILSGESFLYSFELGMGASVLPAFAYYLASPLNLLLTLFPEHLLTEGIFVITLVKNTLIAAGAAFCLQYIYRRRTPAVAVIALMYSMMMYVLAYSWNIMWLDGVLALPLVVMGFEHLMRRGKYLPYVLSLAYALYANYYIAFMLCIFLVLYYFTFLLRDKREVELNRRSLWRFTVGSLLGGGLAMFLVLPTFLALGSTSAAGALLPEMDAYFEMFDLLGRQLYEVSPTIRSGNLPNLYCGVAVMLLVPLFAMNRGIPRRRRVVYMGLLAVMAASLVINQVNLLWHGLHSPNDLPYRFSFIYCFVLLLISYEVLLKIRHITLKQILLALGGVLVYLMVEERFGDSVYDFKSIYVSLFLVGLYALICWMMSRRRALVKAGQMLLLTVVMAELTLNASTTLIKLNNNEHYTGHGNYVDNLETASVRAAVESMESQVAAQTDNAFARMEFLPRRTCMDTALFDYAGITSFASSNSYRTTRLMGALGYDVNGVNSYLYKSFMAPTDSLLGIRYVALQSEITGHAQLKLVDTVETTGENGVTSTYYIYENTAALSLAFRAEPALKSWASSYYDPMTSINTLYTSLTGDSTPLFTPMSIGADGSSASGVTIKSDCAFYFDPSGSSKTAVFTAAADAEGQYFIYVDCRGADSIRVTQGSNSWNVTTYEPYFIDAGSLTAGDIATVSVTSDSACSGNVYMLRMDAEVFESAMETLSANEMTVTEFTDTRITGTVNATADGVMFTSIPYDAGWTVKVDGKTVECYGLDTADPDSDEPLAAGEGLALLGFDIPAGAHTVEITFRTKGLTAGIALSVVSLLLLIAAVLFTGRLAARANATRFGWMVDEASLDPGDPYRLNAKAAPLKENAADAEVPVQPEEERERES